MVEVVGGSAGWKSGLLQCLLLQMQIDERQEQKAKGYCSHATFHIKTRGFSNQFLCQLEDLNKGNTLVSDLSQTNPPTVLLFHKR